MKIVDLPKEQDRRRNNLDNIVFSSRVRMARNIEALKFPLNLSDKEKLMIESKLVETIKTLGFSHIITSIDNISKDMILYYISNGIITKRFLNSGSTILFETNGEWIVLLNELEHIKIFSIEYGYNVKNMYKKISNFLSELEKKVNYAYDEKYGYLTSSVINVGTGLRVSNLINLFGLYSLKKINELQDAALKIGFNISPYNKDYPDIPLYIIMNVFSLGIPEDEIIEEYEKFLINILKLEEEARKEYFSKREDANVSIENLMRITNINEIDYENSLYYITLFDAMNRILITSLDSNIFKKLLFQISDEFIMYRRGINKPDINRYRLSLVKNALLHIKYKEHQIQE